MYVLSSSIYVNFCLVIPSSLLSLLSLLRPEIILLYFNDPIQYASSFDNEF